MWLCGWKVGQPSWNTHLSHSYFLDCELGHMGRACSLCLWVVVLDCSVQAPLHTGIPWKHRFILKHSGKLTRHCGYSQISFVFPSFMGKAEMIVPCCYLKSCEDKMLPVMSAVTLHPAFYSTFESKCLYYDRVRRNIGSISNKADQTANNDALISK